MKINTPPLPMTLPVIMKKSKIENNKMIIYDKGRPTIYLNVVSRIYKKNIFIKINHVFL